MEEKLIVYYIGPQHNEMRIKEYHDDHHTINYEFFYERIVNNDKILWYSNLFNHFVETYDKEHCQNLERSYKIYKREEKLKRILDV